MSRHRERTYSVLGGTLGVMIANALDLPLPLVILVGILAMLLAARAAIWLLN